MIPFPNEFRRYYSKYMLRNLSKKEYIREDGTPEVLVGMSSLGQALFARICWSSDGMPTSMPIPKEISSIRRGAWAGDRFDVVLYEDVMQNLELEGWETLQKK
ncbi:hypothetical protein BDQ17DRAFT_1433038 [Cyathus striatus]|nr:hypothetical protein BDQ17DRAFT_1433038 [Cyathus striatus]